MPRCGHPSLLTHLEHLHFSEGQSPGEAQAELDPVSIFSQVLQCQVHGEAGRGDQMQDLGSGGKIRGTLRGPEVKTSRTEARKANYTRNKLLCTGFKFHDFISS